jgi:hypothetical protein
MAADMSGDPQTREAVQGDDSVAQDWPAARRRGAPLSLRMSLLIWVILGLLAWGAAALLIRCL